MKALKRQIACVWKMVRVILEVFVCLVFNLVSMNVFRINASIS